MNTFNKSQIFKSAWNLVKSTGAKISDALRSAWAIAKGLITETVVTVDSIIKRANSLGFWDCKVWCKGDKVRIYATGLGKDANVYYELEGTPSNITGGCFKCFTNAGNVGSKWIQNRVADLKSSCELLIKAYELEMGINN